MAGKAVIVAIFSEPENDMEMAAIIETLQNSFRDREPETRLVMGVNDIADRVVEIFKPLDGGEARPDLKAFLDDAIVKWRQRKINAVEANSDVDKFMASCYVDAFQSVRRSMFGEVLSEEDSGG